MSASGHDVDFVRRKSLRRSAFEILSQKIEEWEAEYAIANRIIIGRKPDAGSVVAASNDYLSVGTDERITRAITDALCRSGQEIFMSSVFVQYMSIQDDYERAMAAHLRSEAAVLCQSGWAANQGLLQVLADDETPVYIDFFAHASLWQGILSGGAKPRPFRHNNPESLRDVVRRHGPGIVVVDAVYSTTGDVCPLRDVVEIAEAQDCIILVDESHAIGVRGPRGAGLVVQLGLENRVHFRTFSLSKALAGRGGIVAGPARELFYFRFQSHPSIFSSAVLPHEIAGFAAALDVVRSDEWRREALAHNCEYLKAGLARVGLDIADHDSPIIALIGGAEETTHRLRDALEMHNVFGAVFCAPATPKNRSLIRLTLTAAMQRSELDRIIGACAAIRRELGII